MSKYVERFSAVERVMHWTLVVSFFVLVLSGLGLYSHAFFGYFAIFGGPQNGILFHKWASILFVISSVLLFLSHFRETTTFDEDDRRWFKAAGGYLSRDKTEIPQGKFNAGQKLFGIFSIFGTIILAISGLIIWDPTFFFRGLTQFSLMIHGLFFTLFMMAAIVHIYLATVGNPGTSAGMLWGQVTRAWAKKHASKWYKTIARD
jgi:formate dehydrogenase subunit gamma